MINKEIHLECAKEFDRLFPASQNGNSAGCDIWDVCVNGNEGTENCIGENFNQIFLKVKEIWFRENNSFVDTSTFYHETYILWLYMMSSRIREVFFEMRLGNSDKFQELFPSFREIILWANFLKHPKGFMYSYWHQHIYEQEKTFHVSRERSTIIDLDYLQQHYNKPHGSKAEELKRNMEVVVQYPDLLRLTKGFVDDFFSFKDLICVDPAAIQRLRDEANLKPILIDSNGQEIL